MILELIDALERAVRLTDVHAWTEPLDIVDLCFITNTLSKAKSQIGVCPLCGDAYYKDQADKCCVCGAEICPDCVCDDVCEGCYIDAEEDCELDDDELEEHQP